MTLDDLKSVPLLYVATPYSRYNRGHIVAFYDACMVTAQLLKRGLNVFSPIAHSHAICDHGHLPHLDHPFWLKADEAFMAKSDALLVVRLDGWDNSQGIAQEIQIFRAAGKPIHHLDPETLELI